MYRDREPRPKWHMPAALIGAAAMVAVSMDIRDDWDDSGSRKRASTTTTTITILPERTTLPTTSTTLPEVLRPSVTLATGPLVKDGGLLFDNKRAVGVDCAAGAAQSRRTGKLRLPLDLGTDSIARTPFGEIDRVVFLGRELSRSIVSHTLSDGLAVVLDEGQFSLYSFQVAETGLLASARGTLLRPLTLTELRGPEGVRFEHDIFSFHARIDPTARVTEQLELSIACVR